MLQRSRLSFAVVLILAISALGIVGCSDSDSSSSTTMPSEPMAAIVTLENFATKATAICKQRDADAKSTERRRKQVEARIADSETPELRAEYVELLRKSSARDARAQEEVAALDRPENPAVAKYVDGWRDRVALTRQVIDAIESGDDFEASAMVDRLEVSRARGAGQAEVLGIVGCTKLR